MASYIVGIYGLFHPQESLEIQPREKLRFFTAQNCDFGSQKPPSKIVLKEARGYIFYETRRIHGTGICIYIWLIRMISVGKYTIHGSYVGNMRLAILLVTFLGWLNRDLQRLGMERSRLESPGGYICL